MNTSTVRCLVWLAGLLSAGGACAQRNLDRCDDILRADLFNRSSTSTQSSASQRQAFQDHLFKLDEKTAFETYKKAYQSGKVQSTSGSGEGHYAIAGGSFEFAHGYDRQLSESEFSQRFNEAKSRLEADRKSSSASTVSLISLYQSSVRDAGSVQAWQKCMTSGGEVGLSAYGYRDASGSPFLVVVWAPGAFASTHPAVDVRFAVGEPGITVQGAPGVVSVAAGSGASFPIRFARAGDARGQWDGFTVMVNGELKASGRVTQSFRAEAVIPPNLGPVPCERIVGANKRLDMSFFNKKTQQVVWGTAVIAVKEKTASDVPGNLRYTGGFGPTAGPLVDVAVVVSGTRFIVEGDGKTLFAGECSGRLIRAEPVLKGVWPGEALLRVN